MVMLHTRLPSGRWVLLSHILRHDPTSVPISATDDIGGESGDHVQECGFVNPTDPPTRSFQLDRVPRPPMSAWQKACQRHLSKARAELGTHNSAYWSAVIAPFVPCLICGRTSREGAIMALERDLLLPLCDMCGPGPRRSNTLRNLYVRGRSRTVPGKRAGKIRASGVGLQCDPDPLPPTDRRP